MPNVDIIDITDLITGVPQNAHDRGTNNICGERQKEQKPIAIKKETRHMCNNDLAHVSSMPTDAEKRTQKHPREPDVASTFGSVKRPCTNPSCRVGRLCADDDEEEAEADDKAHVRSAAPGETASNAHLTRGEDIVLEEIQSYPQASTESYYYSSTAIQHIFRDRSAFETYETPSFLSSQTKGGCVKGFCRSGLLYAGGRGTVRVEGRCGDRVSSICLRNVLHYPASEFNLISGIQLDKAGVTTTLGNGRITLSLRGTNIVDGQICDDMYRLNMSVISDKNLGESSGDRYYRQSAFGCFARPK